MGLENSIGEKMNCPEIILSMIAWNMHLIAQEIIAEIHQLMNSKG